MQILKLKQFPEEIGKNLYNLGVGKHFSDSIPKAKSVKEKKSDTLDFIKIYNFCSLKEYEKTRQRE